MKKNIFIVITMLLFIFISSGVFANESPVEYYKQGVMAFKNQDWEESIRYFDEVIMNDLFYSDYRAKSIYFKTILLAAEIEKDLELYDAFKVGIEEISFKNKTTKKEFRLKADNYSLKSKRNVDTLIGLANYLLANLPPVDITVPLTTNNIDSKDSILKIKSGEIIEENRLKALEENIFNEKVEKYLSLTLNGKAFNNLFIIRAEEGDNLYYLSHKHEVPFKLLIDVNDHIKDPNTIYPNQKVYIPKISSYMIDYPAYFYYIGRAGHNANPRRNKEISRLVFKAYQLTAEDNIAQKVKGYTPLEEEIKAYQEKIRVQAEALQLREEEIEEIREKYNVLIKELKEIKGSLEENSSEKDYKLDSLDDFDDLESYDNEYNPKEDSLEY